MRTKENVYNVIKNDERFTILSKILKSTGIDKAMSEEDETFTFFAPTDEAFHKLSTKALQILVSPEGRGVVAAIFGQLVIPGKYLYSNDLRREDSVKTLHGNKLEIRKEANALRLEGAHIQMPGTAASNGVIFPVDRVIPAKRKKVLTATV